MAIVARGASRTIGAIPCLDGQNQKIGPGNYGDSYLDSEIKETVTVIFSGSGAGFTVGH